MAEDNDDVSDIARYLLQKHGTDAARVAEDYASSHRAEGEHEGTEMWTEIAAEIRRILFRSER